MILNGLFNRHAQVPRDLQAAVLRILLETLRYDTYFEYFIVENMNVGDDCIGTLSSVLTSNTTLKSLVLRNAGITKNIAREVSSFF